MLKFGFRCRGGLVELTQSSMFGWFDVENCTARHVVIISYFWHGSGNPLENKAARFHMTPASIFFLLVQFVVKTVATGALGVMVSWQVSLCSQKVVTLSIDGGGWHCSDMGCPPLSTSSHHQDLDIFDRGFHKASFKSLKLGRGKKPSYDYVVEKNTKKTVWD